MLITVNEAAEALRTHPKSIVRHYIGDMNSNLRRNEVIDSEFLAQCMGCDHRFVMAWLAGYDWAYTPWDVAKYVGRKTIDGLLRQYVPVIHQHRFNRFSAREIALAHAKKEEAHGRAKRKRNGLASLLPPPNTLPPTDWGFVSAVDKRGAGLPRGYRTALRRRPESTLPVLDRGWEWYR